MAVSEAVREPVGHPLGEPVALREPLAQPLALADTDALRESVSEGVSVPQDEGESDAVPLAVGPRGEGETVCVAHGETLAVAEWHVEADGVPLAAAEALGVAVATAAESTAVGDSDGVKVCETLRELLPVADRERPALAVKLPEPQGLGEVLWVAVPDCETHVDEENEGEAVDEGENVRVSVSELDVVCDLVRVPLGV